MKIKMWFRRNPWAYPFVTLLAMATLPLWLPVLVIGFGLVVCFGFLSGLGRLLIEGDVDDKGI